MEGLIGRSTKDERKMDNEMNEELKMDARKPVMDRAYMALERFESYMHRNN